MRKIIADRPTDATSDAPGPGFLPLRDLADILTVLLTVVVAVIWARLAVQLLGPGSARWRDFTDFLDEAADITITGLIILFVAWFYRARINAERHGYRQRRARGWAFCGWISPSSTSGSRSRSWVTSGGPEDPRLYARIVTYTRV
jgi:hypothetical protein